jgi:hypothetical protein
MAPLKDVVLDHPDSVFVVLVPSRKNFLVGEFFAEAVILLMQLSVDNTFDRFPENHTAERDDCAHCG